MEQYIPKSAVVAEIKGLIKANEIYLSEPETDEVRFQKTGAYSALNDLLHFLNTLEVKEVDLENELKGDWLFADKTEVDCLECMCLTEDMFVSLVKKYFALGIKAKDKL